MTRHQDVMNRVLVTCPYTPLMTCGSPYHSRVDFVETESVEAWCYGLFINDLGFACVAPGVFLVGGVAFTSATVRVLDGMVTVTIMSND